MNESQITNRILQCAYSYLEHADKLIYSYGSRTFLSGYDLYDPGHDMRGNIDCSTFAILALSGITYEESPYAKGTVIGIGQAVADWADRDLADFSDLPDHYVGIAERIGRPYLNGPKGLDLEKAEAMGVSVQMLKNEIRAVGTVRRSVFLADHYKDKGTCFSDPSEVRPGDLAFFMSDGFFKENGRVFSVEPEINHVGIISEDTDMMINSSAIGPAVSKVPVIGERVPVFYAHPA